MLTWPVKFLFGCLITALMPFILTGVLLVAVAVALPAQLPQAESTARQIALSLLVGDAAGVKVDNIGVTKNGDKFDISIDMSTAARADLPDNAKTVVGQALVSKLHLPLVGDSIKVVHVTIKSAKKGEAPITFDIGAHDLYGTTQ